MEMKLQRRKYQFYVIYNTKEFGYVNRQDDYDQIINGNTLFFNNKSGCKRNCFDPNDMIQKVTFTMENIESENK